MKKKILIILPTLNEGNNISILYSKIKSLKISLDLLFIDDGSNDNTIEMIKKISRKKNTQIKIFIIRRSKRLGIGKAHKDGLNFAYRKKYNFAITMDSDLAHDPKYINNLLKYNKKYNLVLGSRFLAKKSYENFIEHILSAMDISGPIKIKLGEPAIQFTFRTPNGNNVLFSENCLAEV